MSKTELPDAKSARNPKRIGSWSNEFVRQVEQHLQTIKRGERLAEEHRGELLAHGVIDGGGALTALGQRIAYDFDEYHWQSEYDPLERLMSLDALPAGLKILDIGCGGGQTLRHLDSTNVALRVGVDIDVDGIAYGERLASATGSDITLVPGSSYELPFRPASFDVVIMRTSLNYMHAPRGLAEAVRVLGPNGYLFCRFECFWYDLASCQRSRTLRAVLCRLRDVAVGVALAFSGWQPSPERGLRWGRAFHTVRRLRRLLEAMGCHVEAAHPSEYGPRYLGHATQIVLLARRSGDS